MLDLINEGNLGLIEAARRFDPGRHVRFISYAVWWIRQAVIHALTQSAACATSSEALRSDLDDEEEGGPAQRGEGPGADAAGDRASMGISEEDVEDLLVLAERDVSLSDRLAGSDLEVEGKIEDRETPPVEYQIVKASIQHQIRDILGELDEKEATVLKSRFGLDDDRPQTLQEIGDRLGLTRERIRQIEQKAMRKLSRSHQVQQLRGYLN